MTPADAAKFEEKTLSRKDIFSGHVIQVKLDTVAIPDGSPDQTREIALHPGGVAILALTQEGKIILVRQFRKALEEVIYEIPAGKIDPEERAKLELTKNGSVHSGFHGENAETSKTLLKAIRRELEEETGYKAAEIHQVAEFYVSPGFTNEKTYLFFATGLTKVEHPKPADVGEILELHEVTLDEALKLVRKGEIDDAKTLIALQYIQLQDINHG
ncbi:MAG: NUDIX hydrolase [Streptococcaceae bacterium]|jgi:ADP-ribose pyrophosphatase|nr:NUDIX hydrolase [Streptococcaceae bacterium]